MDQSNLNQQGTGLLLPFDSDTAIVFAQPESALKFPATYRFPFCIANTSPLGTTVPSPHPHPLPHPIPDHPLPHLPCVTNDGPLQCAHTLSACPGSGLRTVDSGLRNPQSDASSSLRKWVTQEKMGVQVHNI